MASSQFSKRQIVLHYISELDVGGAEKQLALILPRLQKYFDNRVVCAIGRGSIGRQLEDLGITVYYLDALSRFDPRLLLRLYNILRKIRPHTLVTYLILADITGRLVGHLTSVKQIITSQRSSLPGRGYLRIADRITKNLVTGYTVQTVSAQQLLMNKLRLPANKFVIIPNAVHYAASTDTSSKPSSLEPTSKISIICVSQLKPGKGHDLLLPAVASIKSQHPDIKLQLVGDGPLRPFLEHQAQELGLNNIVTFLGSRDDVPQLLTTSDIFVLPTLGEGMSNALLEAMSAGLPCITSDIAANKEVIANNQTGLLFNNQDPADLARAIKALITDNSLRQRLGNAARHYVRQHHTVPAIANAWAALLKSNQ